MKLPLAPLLLVSLSAAVCRAQEFSLQDEKGKTTGPYALKTGTEVAIGSNRAVLANVRTQKQQILDDLLIRRYPVMPNVVERVAGWAREACLSQANATNEVYLKQPIDLKKSFGNLGVSWPNGSYIFCRPLVGRLEVCNTRENLECFERVLVEMGVTPRQIQIDLQFVAFDLTNINRLVASGPGINTASLTALWASGRGELLAAPTVVTKAGQEAVVKGITEVIYPTTFTCLGAEQTNAPNPAVAGVASGAVEPGGFQTRETGMILQVVPEVSAEGQMINLTLNPQVVEDPIWENYGPAGRDASGKERSAQMRQPIFHVYSTSTSVSLAPGCRILIGGGMPNRDGKRAVYLFARATLIDMSGEAIRDEPDQPAR
ncbi:MAG: hypothetical protein ACOYOU_03955 [Kiritimatiellia bacterium]